MPEPWEDVPLVGRGHELSVLLGAVAATGDGRQHIIELSGAAGTGKTRLLAEAGAAATARGLAVAAGTADEGEAAVAGHLFLHALHHYRRPDGSMPLDITALPAWSGHAASGLSRYAGARSLLTVLSGDGLVLLLDRVDMADRASLDLLRHLARYPLRAPLTVVVTYRPGGAPVPDLPDGRRLLLGPLSSTQGATLLGVESGNARYRRWYAESGGNPLHLLALAHGPYDTAVADRLTAEWGRLPEPDRTVTSAVALLGAPSDQELLAAVTQLPPATVRQAVTRLLDRGLLRLDHAGGRVGFRYRMVGRLVRQRTDPLWRTAAHRRAANALSERGADPAALAEHLEHAGQSPQPGTDLTILLAAARRARPATAARWLAHATALSGPAGVGRAERRRIATRHALALVAAGDLGEGRALLADLLASAPAARTAERRALATAYARVSRLLGRYSEAAAALTPYLPAPGAPADQPVLTAEHALIGLLRREPPVPARRMAQARRIATRHGDRVGELTVLAVRALRLTYAGATRPARTAVARCDAILDALPDTALADHPDPVYQVAWAETFLDMFGTAERHLRRGLAAARRAGRRETLPYLLAGLSQLACWTGRTGRADTLLTDARRIAWYTRSHDILCLLNCTDSVNTLWRGGPDASTRAVDVAEQALSAACLREGWWGRTAACVLGQAALADGDPARALAVFLDAGEDKHLRGLQPSLRPTWLHRMCQAALALGDRPAAERYTRLAAADADRLGLAGQQAHARAARAELLLADRDPAAATESFGQAARRFGAAGMAVLQAYALGRLGDAARRAGDHRIAQRALSQASRLADRYHVQTVAAEVTASRAPSGSVAGDPRDALTRRERQIAQLIGTGETNRGIGRALGISTRTVDAHLSRIYHKLDVASRAQVAALLAATPSRQDAI